MNMNGLLRKRLFFFVTSTVFILILTVASSYAFKNSDLNSDVVVFNNEKLKVLYENGQVIEQNSSYPMSFQQGMEKVKPSTIKVINNKKCSVNYYLKISNKEESDNNLSFDKIYYSINEDAPALLSSASKGIVYYGKVNGEEEDIINIKVWMSSEFITNDDQGKSINLKYEILEK